MNEPRPNTPMVITLLHGFAYAVRLSVTAVEKHGFRYCSVGYF